MSNNCVKLLGDLSGPFSHNGKAPSDLLGGVLSEHGSPSPKELSAFMWSSTLAHLVLSLIFCLHIYFSMSSSAQDVQEAVYLSTALEGMLEACLESENCTPK